MDDEFDPLRLGETPEGFTVEEDGSMLVPDDDAALEVEDTDFMRNLASIIPPGKLGLIGSELCDLIERDKDSRKRRDEQYEEGLRRSGLGDDAPGGADFSGASKVVHPVLAEACIDFSSRAIKELVPAQGPVKAYIMGTANKGRQERAARKVKFMNWQLMTQMIEFRSELEQMLTQLPMGGSQYLKFWYDEEAHRPFCGFVGVDEVLLPYAATSFYTSPRITHRQLITKYEYHRRVKSGLYRDIFDVTQGSVPDVTDTTRANDKIEGREDDGYNEDGLRAILEVHLNYEIEDDTLTTSTAPYIITIDEDTEKVLAIYRNWAETDQLQRKLDWFVEWKFIPWRGVYGIGLPHLIGGLSAALTGALRALLDSAHINNAATMMKLKAAKLSGQTNQVSVTQICDIEGPSGTDDIRKVVMPMPFNPPSPVLVQLMEGLYALAKGVVATASEAMQNSGDRTPVGTTMALIEEGGVIYSAIHSRLHASLKQCLAILQRLDKEYLEDQDFSGFEHEIVEEEDFEYPQDIIPVSDPAIFTEAQRFAQIQAAIQMSADQTVPFNKIALYRRALGMMHMDNIDEILPPSPSPITDSAVVENAKAFEENTPLKAMSEQHHMAHIQSHMQALTAPWIMQNPLVAPQILAMMVQHIHEHLMMFVHESVKAATRQLSEDSTGGDMDTLAMQAQQMVAQTVGPMVLQVQQQLAAIHQQVQSRMPPPPVPPELQIQQQMLQNKAQYDQGILQIKQQAEQARQQVIQMDMQLKQQKQTFDEQMAQVSAQLEAQALVLSNQMSKQNNDADNLQHMQTEIAKNHEDNLTQIEMERMRQQGAESRAASELSYKAHSDQLDRVLDAAVKVATADTKPAKADKAND